MKLFVVGCFCRSLGASSVGGCITQDVGRCEPVSGPTVACTKTNRVPSAGERGWHWELPGTAYFGVCTLCTLRASARAVLGSDRAGFRVFPREPSVYKGWSPVRVPPWAQHDPSSEGFLR
jgi:hypothetical protein